MSKTIPRNNTDGRREPKSLGRRTVRYATPEEIRAPLVQHAANKFRRIMHGVPWEYARGAIERDLTSMRRLLRDLDAAKKLLESVQIASATFATGSDHPMFRKTREAADALMMELAVHVVDNTGLIVEPTDTERPLLVVVCDVASVHDRSPQGMVFDTTDTITLTTAVSVLMSEGKRPELTDADVSDGMTCALAFDRERKAIAKHFRDRYKLLRARPLTLESWPTSWFRMVASTSDLLGS